MAFVFSPDPAIGVDIRLGPDSDIAVTPSGDLDLIGNVVPLDNIWQAVTLRLQTSLGTYLFDNLQARYGTRLRRYVEEPMTATLQQAIEHEITTTVLSDPRIQQIASLSVTQIASPPGYQIALSIITVSSQQVGGVITVSGA